MTEPQVHDHIGRYQIIDQIGTGGMGQVIAARDEILERRVAIKVMAATSDEDGTLVGRFEDEARMLARLIHPNVISIYDFGLRKDGAPYIVMEFSEHPSLQETLLRTGPMLWFDSLEVIEGIARGLAAAHQQGILHRDLKPGNILMGPSHAARRTVKIVDFGIGAWLPGNRPGFVEGAPDAVSEILGTPAYMSPEALRGANADVKMDLYSLGVVWYELLTGQLPHSAPTHQQLFAAKNKESPPALADAGCVEEVPAEVEKLLLSLLARRPVERPHSAWAFVKSLRACAAQLKSRQPQLLDGVLLSPDSALLTTYSGLRGAPPSSDSLETAKPDKRAQRMDTDPTAAPIPSRARTLFGRDDAIEELHELAATGAQLISLLGPGGVGKSHLGREFGGARAAQLGGSLVVCDLAPADDALGLHYEMGKALGLASAMIGPDTDSQIGDALKANGPGVVLLDNADRVQDALADAMGLWLDMAPQVQFVMTARSPLAVGVEQRFSVEPLPVPPKSAPNQELSDDPAVNLFIARARQVRAQFKPTGEDYTTIAEIVRVVEGLPLAIELAAARTKLRVPGAILKDLQHTIGKLRASRRDIPARQVSMQATFDWSWDLLAPYEQATLAQLGVFWGGWTMHAAEAVIDINLWPDAPALESILESLYDRSFISVSSTGNPAGEPRFFMLRMVNDYANDKLRNGDLGGDSADCVHRHAAYFAAYVLHLESDATEHSDDVPAHIAAYHQELENILHAHGIALAESWHALAADTALVAQLHYLKKGPVRDGIGLSHKILGVREIPESQRARLLSNLGLLYYFAGDHDPALENATSGLIQARSIGDVKACMSAMNALGHIRIGQGLLETAAGCVTASLALCDTRVRSNAEGIALQMLGVVRCLQDEWEQGASLFEAAHRLATDTGATNTASHAAINLGQACLATGDLVTARRYLEEALESRREAGDSRAQGGCLSLLGVVLTAQDQANAALSAFEEGEDILGKWAGTKSPELATLLCRRGMLEAKMGHLSDANDCLRRAGEIKTAVKPAPQSEFAQALVQLQEALTHNHPD